jgi:hypothetical protein
MLLRYRDERGYDWADIIDTLTLRWPPGALVLVERAEV